MAVRLEREVENGVVVAPQRPPGYAVHVPESHHFPAPGGEVSAIRTERHAVESFGASLDVEHFSTAEGIPQFHLARLLADQRVLKIFHFARFDLGALHRRFGVMPAPVYCTKIASRLARTYTDKHGLKDLVREVLGIDLSKQQQTSDWGAEALTDAQIAYAASDVLHLHALREKLDAMLAREGRAELAVACFRFLPDRVRLDLAGWAVEDIFAHS